MAMATKHADSILRGFASALALMLATVSSHFILGNAIPPIFLMGVTMVVVASLMYGGALSGTGRARRAEAPLLPSATQGEREICKSNLVDGSDK